LRGFRARKGDIKMVEAVGSKSSGTKRGADDGVVKSSRKRQKTLQNSVQQPQALTKEEHLDRIKDQVFRFMDLPGGKRSNPSTPRTHLMFAELRNKVYGYAAEYARRCFPPIYREKKPKVGRGRSSSASIDISDPQVPPRLLPYIGLTQACSLLRTEFRPTWLSTNKIPLCALEGYLKAFLPRPNPKASFEVQKRFKSQFDPSGSLRIWIRKDEIANADITRLVKLANKYSTYTITFHSMPNMSAALLTAMEALVNNKNALWVKYVKNNTISQVRFGTIRIVVKEEYAPSWMKAMGRAQVDKQEEYLGRLDLSEVHKVMEISFGVDYS
jgi:hypothetical protein